MRDIKVNENLERVQTDRYQDVPIEDNRSLWFIWTYKDGDWDADTITHVENLMNCISQPDVTNIFCVWHGVHRTNLYLMNKTDLIERLNKL